MDNVIGVSVCAFIGLGNMGFPMAGHLAAAGHEVRVFNRTTAVAERWAGCYEGAVAASPAEAADGAGFVFTCVGADDDLRAVALGGTDTAGPGGGSSSSSSGSSAGPGGGSSSSSSGSSGSPGGGGYGALGAMAAGAVFVDHTTASAVVARELAGVCAARGIGWLDAPISGGQAGAESGVLTVMCGGEPGHFEAARPVIDAYASAVTLIGPAGSGQLAKMVNQILCAGAIQGAAEALAFGERAGLDMERVLAAVTRGAAGSWYLQNRGHTMVADEFDFGFAVDWMLKDLVLVADAAAELGAPVPLVELCRRYMADTASAGDNRLDATSIIRRYR
ncbi:NAD(P)-dependent oxidoreductase [Candidatus Poriferisocius sp.]|uniref:NAD(P)-dependent oxidoreductase n=1 Tax=Candidatus Poriferisocius sp. TaxID=3101276 RepID=UPI003B02B04E